MKNSENRAEKKSEKSAEIIAEIGQNHNGDMELACALIREAKIAGADVAKFQVYHAPSLFKKEGNEWFDYNCKTELTHEQLAILANECRQVGIEFMASVFDIERIAWLEALGVKRYKVASRSISDRALIKALSETGKRIIASLGMWKNVEFPDIESQNGVDFLYCISKYPTLRSELHLNSVDFKNYAGFSDHTIGITAAKVALTRGAKIIEKHFTLDKSMYGPDHACSMTPLELKELCAFRDEFLECL